MLQSCDQKSNWSMMPAKQNEFSSVELWNSNFQVNTTKLDKIISIYISIPAFKCIYVKLNLILMLLKTF